LDKAREGLPKGASKSERFELPNPVTMVMGNRTVLQNFKDICDKMNRDPQHLIRFLSKEMATAGSIEGGHATFQGKFGSETIRNLLERYVREFMRCPVCGGPDTKIMKEHRFVFLICEACGAKWPMRAV